MSAAGTSEQGTAKGATSVLADFIVGSDPARRNGAADAAVARSLFDTRCAAIAGRVTAAGRTADAMRADLGGGSSAATAAWVTAAWATASAMDDAVAYGAAGAPVWAALFALARDGQIDDDARLRDAGSVGLRAALALWRAGAYQQAERGFDGSGVFATIAATAASARLLELDHRATVDALSIGATQAGGLIANLGTTAGLFHAANAARDAVVAAKLAASGFSGAADILEGRQGFGEAFFGLANSRLHGLGEELSRSRPADMEIRSKPVAGHIDHQRTVRALRSILQAAGKREVRGVVVEGMPPASDGNRFHAPRTPEEAACSLRYVLGCVLDRGTVGLADFRPARIAALGAERIRVRSAPRWDPRLDAEDADALRISVEFADGEVAIAEIADFPASASLAEVEAKWRQAVRELEDEPEAAELAAMLPEG